MGLRGVVRQDKKLRASSLPVNPAIDAVLVQRGNKELAAVVRITGPDIFTCVFRIPIRVFAGRRRARDVFRRVLQTFGKDQQRSPRTIHQTRKLLFSRLVRILLRAVRFLDHLFGFVKTGKRNAHFIRRKVAEVEQMIAAEYGLVRNTRFFQDFAKLRVDTRIFSFPKGTEWILVGIAWIGRRFPRKCVVGRLLDQVHAAIGAASEPGPVFGVALRANHGVLQSTTTEELTIA